MILTMERVMSGLGGEEVKQTLSIMLHRCVGVEYGSYRD